MSSYNYDRDFFEQSAYLATPFPIPGASSQSSYDYYCNADVLGANANVAPLTTNGNNDNVYSFQYGWRATDWSGSWVQPHHTHLAQSSGQDSRQNAPSLVQSGSQQPSAQMKYDTPLAPLDTLGGNQFSYPPGSPEIVITEIKTASKKSHPKETSKPFRCQICSKSFSQAANLTAHKRIHTGEKPFTCSICRRPFSQSSSLVTHKRTHTGERPYPCNHCDKAFTDSSTLTKHLRTHTGHKPYACPLCMMRFTQSGNLHRHMKTHKPCDIE